jgi:hypothetical protein
MNKNTTPRERAAERALDTLAHLRDAWRAYRGARRVMVEEADPYKREVATRAALHFERTLDRLLRLDDPKPVFLTANDLTTDIPGRPGWPIETETEN